LNKENGENENYVLDSTAFLALFEDEPGAETVQKLLESAKKGEIVIFTSFVSFTEVFYITLREKKEEEAKKRIKLMNVLAMMRVESSQELGLIAGRLKSTYRLSFADTWIAATAIFYDAILVHKDPEFEQLKGKLEMLKLPYKKSCKG
jgi:predicted nucleic acid-binding protein